VIVHVVHVKGVTIDKPKYHAPIGANRDGVKALQVALERMQPKAWNIHVLDGLRRIESCQNVAQFLSMLCRYAARVVVIVKPLKSLMANGAEHREP